MSIVALVALRLVVGWHFYKEGAKKLTDPNFSSAGLLSMAKGPLADIYHSYVPDPHGWNVLLASPLESAPLTEEQQAEVTAWDLERQELLRPWKKSVAEWVKDRKAKKEGTPDEPPKLPSPDQFRHQPYAAYSDWAERIDEDWRTAHGDLFLLVELTPEQETATADALEARLHELRQYFEGLPDGYEGQKLSTGFEGQELAIAEYRHELWRLEHLGGEPFATEVPYQKERVQTKSAEARGKLGPWKADIEAMEEALANDWAQIVGEDSASKLRGLLEPEGASTLRFIDKLVTYVTLGVGVCLVLGLFTRIAALVGVGFLISVILSQPPWVDGAVTDFIYYQVVEVAALLVLAAVGAGRWGGLDFFLGSACRKCCGSKGTK